MKSRYPPAPRTGYPVQFQPFLQVVKQVTRCYRAGHAHSIADAADKPGWKQFQQLPEFSAARSSCSNSGSLNSSATCASSFRWSSPQSSGTASANKRSTGCRRRRQRQRFFQPDKRNLYVLGAFDPAMRNGHALAEPGAAEPFPGAQALEDFSLAQIFTVAGQLFADQFEQTLFAAAVNVAVNSLRA